MEVDTELFGSIIEFSIGLTGFAGLVAVFLKRASLLQAVEKFRIVSLIVISISPAFLSFLAISLDRLLPASSTAVRTSCAVMAAYLVVLLWRAILARKRFSRSEDEQINQTFFLIMSVIGFGNIIFQIAASLGAFGSQTFTVFYIGLVILLGMGVSQFVLSIIVGFTASES